MQIFFSRVYLFKVLGSFLFGKISWYHIIITAYVKLFLGDYTCAISGSDQWTVRLLQELRLAFWRSLLRICCLVYWLLSWVEHCAKPPCSFASLQVLFLKGFVAFIMTWLPQLPLSDSFFNNMTVESSSNIMSWYMFPWLVASFSQSQPVAHWLLPVHGDGWH